MIKKHTAAAIVIALFAPLAVFAQSSDESVIFDLLMSLDGPIPKPVATSTKPTAAPVKPAQSQAQTQPQQQVFAPGHLFNVESNMPQEDPAVGSLQSVLQMLMAQFAALASSSTPTTVAATSSATSSKPVEPPPVVYKRNLSVGSRGADVTALQLYLIARKLLFGEATGYFGILTKTAVVTFQTEQGLEPTGTVGPKTRAILNALPTERFQETPPPPPSGPGPIPLIASSTGMSLSYSTTSTSTAPMGSTTPMFDWFAAPVSVSMSLLPAEAPVGGSTAITWLSQNATSCEASDGWSGTKATLGAARIEPLEFSLNFVITCTGPGGVASTSALVVVGGEQ